MHQFIYLKIITTIIQHYGGRDMVNSKGSDYHGVWKAGNEWGAYITVKGEHKHLGNFKIEEHAAIAYLLLNVKQS